MTNPTAISLEASNRQNARQAEVNQAVANFRTAIFSGDAGYIGRAADEAKESFDKYLEAVATLSTIVKIEQST